MIPSLRRAFNDAWTPAGHQRLLGALANACGAVPEFPVSETPCFFERGFIDGLANTGMELIHQLDSNVAALAAANHAVPDRFHGPNAEALPRFLQVDFGLVRTPGGGVEPKLVELQAFASLYGFQLAMAEAYRDAFGLPASLGIFLDGLDAPALRRAGRQAILGRARSARGRADGNRAAPAEDVARLRVTEPLWGVRAVDTAGGAARGPQLFYQRDGRRVPIRRIYNRVIPDELERKGVALPFDYRDELDVEWAGHPAWYFRISKFSIPCLRHPSVPRTWFLHELDRLPDDREHYLLKPLFSFAGGGIIFAPTDAQIAAIPAAERAQLHPAGAHRVRAGHRDARRPDAGRDPHHVRVDRRAAAPCCR